MLLPAENEMNASASRDARFAAVMEAIGAAQASGFTPSAVSDAELDALIEQARHNTALSDGVMDVDKPRLAAYCNNDNTVSRSESAARSSSVRL